MKEERDKLPVLIKNHYAAVFNPKQTPKRFQFFDFLDEYLQ